MSPVLNGVIAAVVIGGAAFLGQSPGIDQPTPAPSAMVSSVPSGDILEVTAAHEAGHVAALREFGIPVWHVETADDGSGLTRYPGNRASFYDYAVVHAAGQESAAAWLVAHRGFTLDHALAVTESAARSDLVNLADDAARAGISVTEARQRARDIVRNHHADIEVTARQLIDHGGSLDEHELAN